MVSRRRTDAIGDFPDGDRVSFGSSPLRDAQFNLADMLLSGDVDVPRDPLPAQLRLADLYDKGA
jgi:hypothetical protein